MMQTKINSSTPVSEEKNSLPLEQETAPKLSNLKRDVGCWNIHQLYISPTEYLDTKNSEEVFLNNNSNSETKNIFSCSPLKRSSSENSYKHIKSINATTNFHLLHSTNVKTKHSHPSNHAGSYSTVFKNLMKKKISEKLHTNNKILLKKESITPPPSPRQKITF